MIDTELLPIFKSEKDREQYFARIERARRKMQVRPRTCLRCQRSFQSAWIGNRICPRCKEAKE